MMDVEELVKRLRAQWKHSEGKSFGVKGLEEAEYICAIIRELPVVADALETLQAEKEDTYNRLLKLTETMEEFGREAEIMIERDKRLKAENITLRAERDALLKSFKVKPVGLEERGD